MSIEDKLPPNTAAVVVNTGDEILRAVGILTDVTLTMQRDPIRMTIDGFESVVDSNPEYTLDFRMIVTEGDEQSIVDVAQDAAPVQQSIDDAKGDDRLDNDDTKRLTD